MDLHALIEQLTTLEQDAHAHRSPCTDCNIEPADMLTENYCAHCQALKFTVALRQLLAAQPTQPHPGGKLIKLVAHYEDGSTQTISGDYYNTVITKAKTRIEEFKKIREELSEEQNP